MLELDVEKYIFTVVEWPLSVLIGEIYYKLRACISNLLHLYFRDFL